MRYVFGDYTLDTDRYELCRAGTPVALGPKPFALLTYLLQHRDRVVAKEELLAQLAPAVCERVRADLLHARRTSGSGRQRASAAADQDRTRPRLSLYAPGRGADRARGRACPCLGSAAGDSAGHRSSS